MMRIVTAAVLLFALAGPAWAGFDEGTQEGGRYVMHIPCMDDSIEVAPVNILTEGAIDSDFNGFDGDSEFTFSNGQVWQQAEYKYAYHYAYRPAAMVVDGLDGQVLHVEGMSDSVRVRRVR